MNRGCIRRILTAFAVVGVVGAGNASACACRLGPPCGWRLRRHGALRISRLHSTFQDATALEPGMTMASDTGERVHVERAGVVAMDLSAADAFPLFNAVGERRWVAGWALSFVHPVEPGAGEGVAFRPPRRVYERRHGSKRDTSLAQVPRRSCMWFQTTTSPWWT